MDPGNLPLLDALRRALPGPLACHVTSRATLEAALTAAAGAPAGATLALLEEDLQAALAAEGPVEPSYVLEATPGAAVPPIIRLVDGLLRNALTARASDIHLEGSEQGVAVKYRIDGMLYPAGPPLPRAFQEPVISRLKVMAELDIAEHRLPQDGRFKLRRAAGPPIDCRLSILPSAFGEGAVIRILDKAALTAELQELKLERLGFPPHDLSRFRRHLVKPYGLILVTGPTGSGKTTTLYAALTEIHTGQDKIVTIEDPIEYQLKGVLQIPVNEKKGLTFARGLRSILRHDPDKIMVGEIRDSET
ncbi:MAG: Flp pilus assembly complex ATPase component TadA, partial [candidate division NC10 bacterium]|nr:Flp pilus assembly complex ATPase component TadA [candidate division NC10 bacterium]